MRREIESSRRTCFRGNPISILLTAAVLVVGSSWVIPSVAAQGTSDGHPLGSTAVYEFINPQAARDFVEANSESRLVGTKYVLVGANSSDAIAAPPSSLLAESTPERPVWMKPLSSDPLASQQWALSPTSTWGSGLDDALAHKPSQVHVPRVAVLDTGWTSHPDAPSPVAQFDFISDVATSNDGNGRDVDATDPGDWCSADGSPSSWHGTATSGVISALSENGIGIRGMQSTAEIIHARVLGACGGYDTDIADAIRWAAGGSVSSVPSIQRVDVINLSLGGTDFCNSYLQDAITFAISQGTVVVAAAGNDGADASTTTPANCAGTIVVGASNQFGARTSYSNYGSSVTLLAPGGDSSGRIIVLGNTGTTVASQSTYQNYVGTSFSAPMVSGAVAWIRSINPGMSPTDVKSILKQTAHSFPSQSNCSSGYDCGSGLLDLGLAVSMAETWQETPSAPTPTAVSSTVRVSKTGSEWSERERCSSYFLCFGNYYYSGTGLWFNSDYNCYRYYYGYSYVDCYQAFNWKVAAPSGSKVTLSVSINGYRPCFYDEGNYAGVAIDSDRDGYSMEWRSSSTKIVSTSGCGSIGQWDLNEGDVTNAISGGLLAYKIMSVEQNLGVYNDGIDDAAAIFIQSIDFNFTSLSYTPTWSSPPQFSSSQPISGQQVSTSSGDWGQGVGFSYQWLRCTTSTDSSSCSDIPSADASTFLPTDTDKGQYLRVRVTGSNSVGATSWTSGPTLAVRQATSMTSSPSLQGGLEVGSLLSTSMGSWVGFPTPTFVYGWYRCTSSGSASSIEPSGCSVIPGALNSTYVITSDDFSSSYPTYIRAKLTAANSVNSVDAYTAASGQITGIGPQVVSAATITGNARVSQVMRTTNPIWTFTPTTITYIWLSCGAPGESSSILPNGCIEIDGATSTSYSPSIQLAGRYLRVRVGASGVRTSTTYSFSATSAQVSIEPSVVAFPVIQGSAYVGATVSGSGGSWQGFPTPLLTYTWFRCRIAGVVTISVPSDCAEISGGTTSSYVVTSSDMDQFLRLRVTGSNDLGSVDGFSATVAVSATPPTTTTSPPAPTPLPATPSTTTTSPPAPTPLPAPPSVRVAKTVSLSSLAKKTKLSVPKGGKLFAAIDRKSSTYCALSGSAVKGRKVGTCVVKLTLRVKGKKDVAKSVSLKVVR